MNALNRRQFLATGAAACACAGCPALAALADAAAEAEPVDAGAVEDFATPGIHGPLGPGGRFFLVSRRRRLYAVSSTCTHRKVKLVVNGGALKCPRHGSRFDLDGRVLKPPARKALPRYPVRVEGGRVLVDLGKPLAARASESPGAFVELP